MERHYAVSGAPIYLGRTGENGVREIVFDISGWVKQYGEGVVQLVACRSGEKLLYPVPVELRDGDLVVWTVLSTDVAIPGGQGKCELTFIPKPSQLKKSETWSTYVHEAMFSGVPESADPAAHWLDEFRQKAASIGAISANVSKSASHAASDAASASTSRRQAALSAAAAKEDAAVARDAAERAEKAKEAVEAVALADMKSSVYDPTGKARDIFAYTDDAVQELSESTVRKTGDTMTGPLTLSGGGKVAADNGVAYFVAEGETALAQLELSGATGQFVFAYGKNDYSDWQGFAVHHGGNKPSGFYTGNGSAALRTIETGGIGRLAVVRSGNAIAFVTDNGAICFETTSGLFQTLTNAQATFADGVLAFATDAAVGCLNYSSAVYYYQVL